MSFAFALLAATAGAEVAPPPRLKLSTWEVPYRMTATRHVMVRVKINGKGPFNFVIDSGAPVACVATTVCEKLGVKPDAKGRGTFGTFEIESGPKLTGTTQRVEDLFQLDGMNGLGLAGVKLHGVLGYTFLAQYRMEFDFTSDTMTWTELDYTPTPLKPVKYDETIDDNLDWVGTLARGLGLVLGRKIVAATPRGSLGLELGDSDAGVTVAGVFDRGAAAGAGVRAGDRLTHIRGRRVKTIAEAIRATADVPAGAAVELKLVRAGSELTLTVTAKEGL